MPGTVLGLAAKADVCKQQFRRALRTLTRDVGVVGQGIWELGAFPSAGCGFLAAIELLCLHCCSYIAEAAFLQLNGNGCMAVVDLLWLHCCGCVAVETAIARGLQCVMRGGLPLRERCTFLGDS